MNIKFLEHLNIQGRELSTIKGWFYILFLLSSLVFTGLTHDGVTTGDYIFHAIGIPPWSIPELNQGIHYSAIFGIIMIILSGKLTINYFNKFLFVPLFKAIMIL
ncbi:hypothetical protein M3231_01830 [Neobacillus mesonae]|nr:hypothetical protein [Neobacillus mesonae]